VACRFVQVIAVAVVMTACGGGSHGSSAHFASNWQSFVANYQTSVQNLQAQGRSALAAGGSQDIVRIVQQLQSLTQTALNQLKTLSPPSSVASLYQKAVQDLKAQHQALGDALTAEAHSDQAGLQRALTRYITSLSQWLPVAQQISSTVQHK
jgi:hypothetical protein